MVAVAVIVSVCDINALRVVRALPDALRDEIDDAVTDCEFESLGDALTVLLPEDEDVPVAELLA